MSASEQKLTGPPTDGITRVVFSPADEDKLLVSSWDASVRLYDVATNKGASVTYEHKAAVLDACFVGDGSAVVSGGLDKALKRVDLATGTERVLGKHDKAIRNVLYSSDHQLIISASWDSTMRVWDERQPDALVATGALPGKSFAAAAHAQRVVIGTAGRHVLVWDVRHLSEPEQRRESSLKYQTRAVACFIDGSGFALASTEGRVAMEYFDPAPEVQAKKYAFKCHRTSIRGVDTVFPVNALAFHPTYGTFASGGCDGIVNVWDGNNKKRLCQFRKYETSISSLGFSRTGARLAVAVSYTFEEGEKDAPLDEIYIRTITDAEARPKAKKTAKK